MAECFFVVLFFGVGKMSCLQGKVREKSPVWHGFLGGDGE